MVEYVIGSYSIVECSIGLYSIEEICTSPFHCWIASLGDKVAPSPSCSVFPTLQACSLLTPLRQDLLSALASWSRGV